MKVCLQIVFALLLCLEVRSQAPLKERLVSISRAQFFEESKKYFSSDSLVYIYPKYNIGGGLEQGLELTSLPLNKFSRLDYYHLQGVMGNVNDFNRIITQDESKRTIGFQLNHWNSVYNQWYKMNDSIYYYNTNGNLDSLCYKQYTLNGALSSHIKSIYYYNTEAKLIMDSTFTITDSTRLLYRINLYEYTDSHVVHHLYTCNNLGIPGYLRLRIEDLKKRPVFYAEKYLVSPGDTFRTIFNYEYTYNDSLHTEVSTYYNLGVLKSTDSTYFEFDEDSNLIKRLFQRKENGIVTNLSLDAWKYAEQRLVASGKMVHSKQKNSWDTIESKFLLYNHNNQLVSTRSFYPKDGVLKLTTIDTISYNSNDNITKLERYRWKHDSVGFTPESKVEYKWEAYSELDSVANELDAVRVFPNPCTDQIILFMTTDLNTKGYLRIMNTAGQVVNYYNFNTHKGPNSISIPMRSLMQGHYFLQLYFQDRMKTYLILKN